MRSWFGIVAGVSMAVQSSWVMGEGILLDVRAGERARRDTIVRWEIPANVSLPSPARLIRVDTGMDVPHQLDSSGRQTLVWLVDGELPSMTMRRYRIEPGVKGEAGLARASCEVVAGADGKTSGLLVSVGGKKVFRYNVAEVQPPADVQPLFARSGYIHPLWSPAGRVVSNDFPANHNHHHGVWMPWSQTEFEGHPINFWEQVRLEGKVECVKASPISGSVFAGVSAEHLFSDLKSKEGKKPVLNETWEVRVYSIGTYSVVDFSSTQRCAGSSPLLFKGYRYGGFGFRGAGEWEGKDGCEFLTSQGKTRKDGHETASFWCEMHGQVGGELAGVAFLCHPANFRAPQNMRIHDTEPFFNYTPCQDGDFELRPDHSLVSQYRLVVHDGKLGAAECERLWWDYAKPPQVIRVVEGEGAH